MGVSIRVLPFSFSAVANAAEQIELAIKQWDNEEAAAYVRDWVNSIEKNVHGDVERWAYYADDLVDFKYFENFLDVLSKITLYPFEIFCVDSDGVYGYIVFPGGYVPGEAKIILK